MTSARNLTQDNAPTKWSVLTATSAVLTALLASACCVGPLVLALLGLGGAGLLLKFEPYRPALMAVTIVLLGVGHYRLQRQTPRAGIECDCPHPRVNRMGRWSLWVATVVVAALLAFPYVAQFLFG